MGHLALRPLDLADPAAAAADVVRPDRHFFGGVEAMRTYH